MIAMQTISNGENVSEIQALVAKIQDLEASVATWNSWRLGFVAVTALVAAALFITSFAAARRSATLARAQSELIRLKDNQLATVLKDKDVEIGKARRDASVADARSAEAHAEAERAKAEAAKANLELARFKAPRTLSPEQQARITAKLKAFVGIVFDGGIGPKGDPEPLFLLHSIRSALIVAGWSHIAWTGGGETYTEPGIPSIGLTMVTNVIVDVHPDQLQRFGAAAKALAAALAAEGIAAIADSQPTSIRSDAIHIRIGRKL
jgi:hypothetical protein